MLMKKDSLLPSRRDAAADFVAEALTRAGWTAEAFEQRCALLHTGIDRQFVGQVVMRMAIDDR